MKIVFLLNNIPKPRISKRIEAMKSIAEISILCVKRKEQVWFPANTELKHVYFDIDVPSSEHILERLKTLKEYKKQALASLAAEKPDLIYTSDIESLQIANSYKRKKTNTRVFYEVGDLRELFIEKPKNIAKRAFGWALSYVEKKNIRTVECLVITSEKFYDVHFKDIIEKDRVLFIPNMPEIKYFDNYTPKTAGPFTIGFIGAIRYIDQMKILVDAASELNCNVLFAGSGSTAEEYNEIVDYCKDKPWITFSGKYNYETDIAKLYSQVDCVYSVYNADNANVRIALPNKLYEAVYCCLPIIVAKGTYLAELVNDWNVGLAVDHKDYGELYNAIKILMDKKSYSKYVESCKKMKGSISIAKYSEDLVKRI